MLADKRARLTCILLMGRRLYFLALYMFLLNMTSYIMLAYRMEI